MLAGDRLRLRVLFLSFDRNDYRTVEKFWITYLPRRGGISPCWRSSEFPLGRMAAPSPCLWASRAAPEHLGKSRRKTFIQSILVRSAAYGIHRASVFLSLCFGCLCPSGRHERGLHFERGWRESGLADHVLLLAHFWPRPEFTAENSWGFCGDSCRHSSICTSSALKGYSWPRPPRIFDDFVNQETRKHRKAILFLVQSSVKRSIRAACGFAFLCYWLETALHGLRALVFHCNCWRTEVLGMDVCDSGRGRPANRQSSWTRICEASAGYTGRSLRPQSNDRTSGCCLCPQGNARSAKLSSYDRTPGRIYPGVRRSRSRLKNQGVSPPAVSD